MAYGESFISKVLDSGDVHAFDRFGISGEILATVPERQAMQFILDYADKYHGQAPDYRTVEAEIDGFEYIPEVTDSFKYLADEVKRYAARLAIHDFWYSEGMAKKFNGEYKDDPDGFIAEAQKILDDIRHRTASGGKVGIDLKRDIDSVVTEYQRRADGKSFKVWQSAFATLNDAVGGYLSSNVYVWFGRSGRGKSVFTMTEAIAAAMQGANVLIWALEMAFYELAARMLAALSALEGSGNMSATVDGVEIGGGFEVKKILMGHLDSPADFFDFLRKLNDFIPGNITIRAIDDPNFKRRDCRQLEVDIKATEADVVVIDPIYYMTMEHNDSKTSGGDVAATSKKLRLLAGRLGVVMHVITQADEVKDDEDEEGNRQLRIPKRAELQKAKQILQDSSNTFAIDTCDGRGVISIGKGRNGGEDVEIEIIYLPAIGIVKEVAATPGKFRTGDLFI